MKFRGMMKFKKRALLNNQGLTLIEVLIALTLVSILFFSLDISFNSEREALESAVEGIERAIRFSSNEAVLRNSIVRIHFELDKAEQEYSVEFGPDGDFVLPLFEDLGDNNKLSLSEQEKRDKMIGDLNKKFNKIKDFKSENEKLPMNVRIIGIATELREGIILDGDASIYFYPTGERDSCFISVSTSKEVLSLEIDPFSAEITKNYQTLVSRTDEGVVQEQEEVLKEQYANWLKN